MQPGHSSQAFQRPRRLLRRVGPWLGLAGLNAAIILTYVHLTPRRPSGRQVGAAAPASPGPAATGEATSSAAQPLSFLARPVTLMSSRRVPASDVQELLAALPQLPRLAAVGPPLPLDDRFIKLPRPPQRRVVRRVVRSGQTPAAALRTLDVAEDGSAALASLADWIDFRKTRPGDVLTAHLVEGQGLQELEISRGPIVQVRTRRGPDGWHGERAEVVLDTVVAEVSGTVRSSLWDALIGAGEDARLVATLVDIFAYDIDFYNQVRPADSFFLLVEKRYVNGQFVEYGDVTAAEFVMGGVPHRAFLHRGSDGRVAYYDAAGRSMRKQLLKAPLKYALVTSRFGMRRHPVLGYTRSHNGTDYGVPVGTPVWAVGDGRVLRAGWHGGFGRLVEIVHPNGWVSQYAHLSRIYVRPGSRVTQKQVLGLVGQTGLATGPHLHYGLKRHGHYVNSLAQHFERSAPLSNEALADFHRRVAQLMDNLHSLRLAQDAGDSSATAS